MHYVYNLRPWPLLLCFVLLTSCKTDYQNLPAFSAQKQLQVVVLTPAGSNQLQAYDPQKKVFTQAQVAGLPAKIDFLSCPGNLGFIPSTAYKNTENTTETRLLEALVLSESQPTGTVQEVIPIATAVLFTESVKVPVIIAVPARPSERIISVMDLADLKQQYPAAQAILQKWFSYSKPPQPAKVVEWLNQKETEQLIRRWLK